LRYFLCLLLFFPNQALAETFPDVKGHWAQEEIEYLTDRGIIKGYSNGTFGVNDTIKRDQVAAILARQQELVDVPADYPDVPADQWANGEIGAVTNAGIMQGYLDGQFRPDNYVNRAQAATVLANAFDLESSTVEPHYSDVGTGHWAFNDIQAMTDNHIARGYSNGTFKGGQEITRAEFAVFLARQLNPELTKEIRALKTSEKVVKALAEENMATFSEYVHPELDVRFSPYVYVKTDHLTFSKDEIPNLLSDTTVYDWGVADGTGYPIEKTPQEYFDRFVNNKDYRSPDEVVYNEDVPRGSMINNIPTYFANGVFVEYFVDYEEYEGLDWSSLIIVLYEYEGEYHVVGIVNDEWTI
jgi:hypothetical protein